MANVILPQVQMNAGVNYAIPGYSVQNSSFNIVNDSNISMNPSRVLAPLLINNSSFSVSTDRNNASISSRDSFADGIQLSRGSAFNVLGRDPRLSFQHSRGDTLFIEGNPNFSFGNISQTNESIADLLAGFNGPVQSFVPGSTYDIVNGIRIEHNRPNSVSKASFSLTPPTITQVMLTELDKINQSIGDQSMKSVNKTQPMDITLLSNANKTELMDVSVLPSGDNTKLMDLTLLSDNSFVKPMDKFKYKVPDLKLNESSMISVGNLSDSMNQSLITDTFKVTKKIDNDLRLNTELTRLLLKFDETKPQPTNRYWKWTSYGPSKAYDFGQATGDEYEKITKEYQKAYEHYHAYVIEKNSIIKKYKK